MSSSEKLSKKLSRTSSWVIAGWLIVSALGFIDAAYLTVKHYLGQQVSCSILGGCEEVLTSKYSVVFGLPLALYGVFYYLTIFALTLVYLDIRRSGIADFIIRLSGLGFGASLYFVYLQVFIIKALCFYCLLSAVFSTLLFVLGVFWWFKRKQLLAISG